MKLQTKSVLFFDTLLLAVCLLLGVFGYYSANVGFETALEEKADSDMRQAWALLDLYYPGFWHLRSDGLYKGGKKMDGAFDVVDNLSRLNGNNVTIFREDIRVATTFAKDDAGHEAPAGADPFANRSVGTKASEEVVQRVLRNGDDFHGEAEVLGEKYLCAYAPIKDTSGKNIGMLFMGIPKGELESLQYSFIHSMIFLAFALAIVTATIMSLWLRRAICQPILRLKASAESFVGRSKVKKDLSVIHFENPDIHTHDEIEDLSLALTDMCSDMQAYTEELIQADRKMNVLKEKIVKMDTLVYQDALTGVGNKAAYENVMSRMDWDIITGEAKFAILMLDLNYLKKVNDTFGHERGNFYIINMCVLLKDIFPDIPIFRIGGDEFTVILQGDECDTAEQSAARVRDRMDVLKKSNLEPWEKVSASIGVAIYDAARHEKARDVFAEADEKMYAEKKAMGAVRE